MYKISADYSNGIDKSIISVIRRNDDDTFEVIKCLEENDFIRWLFNNRCVGIDEPCYKFARDISHIEGRQIDDSWQNKVLHCVEHHTEWHRKGASDEAIAQLKERRIEYLEEVGRSDYI